MDKLLGYEVAVNGQDGAGRPVYFLTGARGATYVLMRSQHHPEFMFPVNSKGHVCALKGNGWFTDRDGRLEVLNPHG